MQSIALSNRNNLRRTENGAGGAEKGFVPLPAFETATLRDGQLERMLAANGLAVFEIEPAK